MEEKLNDKHAFEQDIEQRIKAIESENYDFGPMNKNDKIGILFISFVCITGMIWGYF